METSAACTWICTATAVAAHRPKNLPETHADIFGCAPPERSMPAQIYQWHQSAIGHSQVWLWQQRKGSLPPFCGNPWVHYSGGAALCKHFLDLPDGDSAHIIRVVIGRGESRTKMEQAATFCLSSCELRSCTKMIRTSSLKRKRVYQMWPMYQHESHSSRKAQAACTKARSQLD